MEPTYTFSEIKSLVKSLDYSSVSILEELIWEELEGYSFYERRALARMLELKDKVFVLNEVNAEFLLSYN